LQNLQGRVIFAPQIVKRKNNMTQGRGKYASLVQIERRAGILSETLKLLEQERPSDTSIGQIAKTSDVSTKFCVATTRRSRGGLRTNGSVTHCQPMGRRAFVAKRPYLTRDPRKACYRQVLHSSYAVLCQC
jgi:hypothetical protein